MNKKRAQLYMIFIVLVVFGIIVFNKVFPSSPQGPDFFDPHNFKIAALKGPTGMGLAQMLEDYDIELFGSADEITPKLIKGELDMACVPANLASVLYNKTEGQIVTVAINTLGVLYIVDTSGTVSSVEDLRGKTIVSAGKGATPEYALTHILETSGLMYEVNIDWKSEHAECVSALAKGQAELAMLPQPFVTVAQEKIPGLEIALDLNELWEQTNDKSGLVTGVLISRADVAKNYPNGVKALISAYEKSVDFVNTKSYEAAPIIGKHDIVEEEVAKKAIPYCNIVCITGKEMKQKLSGYLEVLSSQNPEAVGGNLPGEDFYFK